MDDFFLQPHQRTQERFNTPGGNIDSERFSSEIVHSLNEEKNIVYHKFNCSKMELGSKETMPFKKINVVEGAYSMHPDFKNYYNISVFMNISEELQKERILKRNPDMADRFFNNWIPMEHKYFNAFDIKQKCDFIIDIN
jgi:uridine kinase